MQRTTRKLVLTEAGELYLSKLRGILLEIEDAETAVRENSSELQGTVRIVTSPMLASYILAPLIAPWRRRFPQVAIEIDVDLFPQARVADYDITLMAVDAGYDANVVVRPLVRAEWILCASPEYLHLRGTPHRPDDLKYHDYLKHSLQTSLGKGAGHIRLYRASNPNELVDIDMQPALQSVSMDVLLRAALSGAGIAVHSRLRVVQHIADGELVNVLPDWIFGRLIVFVALPTRKLVPARTRAFLDYIVEWVQGRDVTTE